jgi:hypothetical protein
VPKKATLPCSRLDEANSVVVFFITSVLQARMMDVISRALY